MWAVQWVCATALLSSSATVVRMEGEGQRADRSFGVHNVQE